MPGCAYPVDRNTIWLPVCRLSLWGMLQQLLLLHTCRSSSKSIWLPPQQNLLRDEAISYTDLALLACKSNNPAASACGNTNFAVRCPRSFVPNWHGRREIKELPALLRSCFKGPSGSGSEQTRPNGLIASPEFPNENTGPPLIPE